MTGLLLSEEVPAATPSFLVTLVTTATLWALVIGLCVLGRRLFGARKRSRLGALVIAAAMFPRTLGTIFLAPFSLIEAATRPAPETSLERVSAAWINATLSDLDITYITFAVGVAALVGFVADQALAYVGPKEGERPGSVGHLSRRFYAGLVAVFLSGSFLAIAALAAIPWVTALGQQEDQVDEEQLREALDSLRLDDDAYALAFPETPETDNPFIPLRRAVEQRIDDLAALERTERVRQHEQAQLALPPVVPQAPAPTTSGDEDDARERLSAVIDEIEKREYTRSLVLQQWRRLRVAASAEEIRLRERAVMRFTADSTGALSAKESARLAQQLRSWYQAELSQIEGQLRRCMAVVEQHEAFWHSWASGRVPLVKETEVDARIPRFEPQGLFQLFSRASDAQQCDLQPSKAPLPSAADPGYDWGPFGVLARWLLRTRSLPLSLITGTLGFGLMGAVVSALIRRFRERDEWEESLEHGYLFSVVVRGFSAAIVTFLGVEGGIAAFAATEAQPDSYVVLFVCFGAAVFSEEAWSWVRGQLRGHVFRTEPPPPASKTPADPPQSGGENEDAPAGPAPPHERGEPDDE